MDEKAPYNWSHSAYKRPSDFIPPICSGYTPIAGSTKESQHGQKQVVNSETKQRVRDSEHKADNGSLADSEENAYSSSNISLPRTQTAAQLELARLLQQRAALRREMEQAKEVIEALRKERTISQRGSSTGSLQSNTFHYSKSSRKREYIRVEKEILRKEKEFI